MSKEKQKFNCDFVSVTKICVQWSMNKKNNKKKAVFDKRLEKRLNIISVAVATEPSSTFGG